MTATARRDTDVGRRVRQEAAIARSKLIAVRLPDDLLERLDKYARQMEQLHGLKLSRSQQIKSLVELGLKATAEAAPKKR